MIFLTPTAVGVKILNNKRYRENKDFFDCNIKIIIKAIKKTNKLLLEFRE